MEVWLMVEPSSNNALQPDELQYGSINDITQRLLLWGKRTGMGLLRVEFSSEFARQAVLQRLQSELAQLKVPFKDIVLPTYQQPAILADALEQELDKCESGVVSISGFATAFSPNIPLAEAMYSLNIRRERLAQRPLRQIWWMTPVFYQTALHAMPDLMSWFSLRLELTESLKGENLFQASSESTVNIDDARRRSLHLIQRFEQALQAGGDCEELLRLYLLPALEALAEVGAQKDLRDLTTRFEGYLSYLRTADSLELADSLARLGQFYYRQGRYLEAEPLLLKSLALIQKLLGSNHSAIALSLSNLAGLYYAQGRYSEAESLYLQSLEITEGELGLDHLYVAASLNNLAALYEFQGRYSEAEALYIRSIKINEKQLSADHPNFAAGLSNLALLYKSQGRYSEAEPLYLQSLRIRESLLGSDHPDTANGLHNLAGLYQAQGRYVEAESLLIRALEIRERQLGADHPEVASSLNNLARLYAFQGRYTEAESLLIRAIAIRRKVLGDSHPDTVNSLRGLDLLKDKQSSSSQAEAFWIFR
jgi:tetratricopeptide (TPR) repeat protein